EAETGLGEDGLFVGSAIDFALARAGGFDGNAPGVLGAFPRAGGAELGDDVGLDAAGFFVALGDARRAAVGVDADDVDVGAEVVERLDAGAADFGDHRHRRVV